MSARMSMGIEDYIAHQEKAGVFSDDAAAPENDPRALRAYWDRIAAYYPGEAAADVTVLEGKYGFFRDPADDERAGLNWAMMTPIIDMNIGIPFAVFEKDLHALLAEDGILTDSFSFSDGYGDLGASLPGLIGLNSPVADMTGGWTAYMESLTSDRRKKYRRMLADFEGTPLRFALSGEALSPREMDFILSNLERKWGADAGYAFRQTLWAAAVQQVRPRQSLVMRVMDGDALAFVQTMIVKRGHVYCQSIAKDEGKFFNGLAAFTDFKCIEALCGRAEYRLFDPSCRTSLSDPESIGIAKRATVNKNLVKPVFAAGKDFAPDLMAIIKDGSIQGKEA